ncbi:hypothetical protein D3C73_16140 [compost metagenome]
MEAVKQVTLRPAEVIEPNPSIVGGLLTGVRGYSMRQELHTRYSDATILGGPFCCSLAFDMPSERRADAGLDSLFGRFGTERRFECCSG